MSRTVGRIYRPVSWASMNEQRMKTAAVGSHRWSFVVEPCAFDVSVDLAVRRFHDLNDCL